MPTKKELQNKSDREVVQKLDEMFVSSIEHPTWVSWRKNAVKCFKYKEGDQWTFAEKAVLAERNQPDTVNNQVKVTVDRLVGQFVTQRTRTGYRGRNPQDQSGADSLNDIFLFIRQNNALEFEERETFEDGATCGFGVLETYISYDDLFFPEIKIRSEDPFNVHPDPDSRRYNWNEDAEFICRSRWLDVDVAKEMYPGKANEIIAWVSSDQNGLLGEVEDFKKTNYIDKNKDRIRVIEVWYRKKEIRNIILAPDRPAIDEKSITKAELKSLGVEGRDYQRIEKLESKMMVGIFSGPILFKHKSVDRKNFPFVPYFVQRMKSGEPYSNILISLPIQDAINKRESKAIHLLNANQSIYERGAVRDRDDHATEKARPDGQIEVEPGFMSQGKFIIKENVDLAATQFQMHGESKRDYRIVTGVNPDALGERSEVRSGVGIARKQAMTDLIIAPGFDNFRRTRVILALNILELVQKYFTEEKIFAITDDLGSTREVVLNPGGQQSEAMKQGIYDVIVDDLPDTITTQQEQFQILAQTIPTIVGLPPVWQQIFLQSSDLRNKDEYIKMLQESSQPPPNDPKISVSAQMSELSAVEKAFFYQKMGSPELAQVVMQEGRDPAHVLKSKVDIVKAELSSEEKLVDQELEFEKIISGENIAERKEASVNRNNNST